MAKYLQQHVEYARWRYYRGWDYAVNVPITPTSMLCLRADQQSKPSGVFRWSAFFIQIDHPILRVNTYRAAFCLDLRPLIIASWHTETYSTVIQKLICLGYLSKGKMSKPLLESLLQVNGRSRYFRFTKTELKDMAEVLKRGYNLEVSLDW